MVTATKQQELIDFLVEEDKKILKRIEEAVAKGEAFHPSQIQKMHSEIRVPVMF